MSIDRPAWQARGDTEVCQGGRFGLQRPKRGWIKDDIRVLFSVRYSIRERMHISSHLLCQSFEFFSFTPFGAVMLIFSFFCCWPLINKSKKKRGRFWQMLWFFERESRQIWCDRSVSYTTDANKRETGEFFPDYRLICRVTKQTECIVLQRLLMKVKRLTKHKKCKKR